MSQTLATFDEAIAVTADDAQDGTFHINVPPNWTASGRAAGGLVEAQLFAGLAHVMGESDKQPLSFTAHLLRAPEQGAARVHVEVLREGRSVTNLAVNMTQQGKLIATALASFATSRQSPDLDEQPPPQVDPPSLDRKLDSFIPEFAYPFGDNIVIQDRTGPKPFSAPDGPMERVGWVGLAHPRPVDAAGLLLFGDIGMMGWWVRLDRMHTTATLDHTTHFRADLRTVEAHDMVLMWSRTNLVRGGYLDWDVALWSPHGQLLCQSRQLLAVLG